MTASASSAAPGVRSGRTFDVIVAGLGAMGSAAAYHLARQGLRVLGLDAFEPGHTRGSSHGETRIIRLSYAEHPDYVPLLRRAYRLWAELEREAGEPLLRLTGGLYAGPPGSPLVEGARRSAQEHDLAHQLLDASELRRRFPAFRPDDSHVALFEEQAGVLFPERCIAAHCALARRAGADLRYKEPLLAWSSGASPAGAIEVRTAHETYSAERLVLTTGAWLGPTLGPLSTTSGRPLPLTVERNVTFWFLPPAGGEAFSPERFPVFIYDEGESGLHGAYGIPHFAGSAREGVKVARHHTQQFVDPNAVDRTVTPEDEAPVRAFVRRRLPALDVPARSSVVCLYTNTPDEHFILDRQPEHGRVVFASACSGHGFKFAAAIGQLLAALATTGALPPEAEFLRLARLT